MLDAWPRSVDYSNGACVVCIRLRFIVIPEFAVMIELAEGQLNRPASVAGPPLRLNLDCSNPFAYMPAVQEPQAAGVVVVLLGMKQRISGAVDTRSSNGGESP